MPLTGQVCVVWTLHLPATLVQVELSAHDWPGGLLQLPGVGEQTPAPLGQGVPAGVTQVPGVFVHAGPGLQARPLVLQVPGVGEQVVDAVQV